MGIYLQEIAQENFSWTCSEYIFNERLNKFYMTIITDYTFSVCKISVLLGYKM